MPQLKQIIYTSRATGTDPLRDTCDIIRVSHNRNSRDELSGVLVLLERHFLQVLEGYPWQLDACLERIAADTRHTDIEVRSDLRVAERSFGHEWMAMRHCDAISASLRERFDYRSGLPAESMPSQRLLEFALACYHEGAP